MVACVLDIEVSFKVPPHRRVIRGRGKNRPCVLDTGGIWLCLTQSSTGELGTGERVDHKKRMIVVVYGKLCPHECHDYYIQIVSVQGITKKPSDRR